MGMHDSLANGNGNGRKVRKDGRKEIPAKLSDNSTIIQHRLPTPSPSPDGKIYPKVGGLIREYLEVWDYVGGLRFRGFVAESGSSESDDECDLFVFFDAEVVGKDLKPGLMSLLELASSDALECSRLVACVDRSADREDADEVTRSLGWVGFELMTLDAWAGSGSSNLVSDRWLFLGIDV